MAESTPNLVVPIRRQYHGCSLIKAYEQARKLGEGTFGEVYQGIRKSTSEVVALKKILMHNEKEGFPITALREIKLLKTLAHENVIRLEEMAVERVHEANKKARATLYMVTPYMEHDLSGMLDNPEIGVTEPMRKTYMQQLLMGLNYLHQNHILHRDMKAANLLINNVGILKIADFGLARHYEGPVPQQGRGNGEATRDYTSLVVTRWYRPPELLMQLRRYTPAIDMWGAGCVFGEMYKRKPILTGQSDLHQAQIIFDLVGSPSEKNMPGWTTLPGSQPMMQMDKTSGSIDQTFRDLDYQGLSLLKSLLALDWRTRINAIDALAHPYFTTPPLPARPEDIPRFKDSHELDRRNNRPNKQALPPAPQGGTVGGGGVNAEWQGDRDSAGPAPQYLDRYVPGERGASGSHRQHQSNRVPAAVHGREQHGNGSRPHERDHASSGVPAAARRPAGDADALRSSDERGQPRTSHLPPPPGQGARHPLPMNPLRNDTYLPNRSDRSDRPRRDDRDERNRRDDRGPRRDDRRSRTPDRRHDRYGDDRGDRRPPDNYRDYDAPPRDRYRDDKRDDHRDNRDSRRDRSPRRDHDRDRDRAYRDR